MRVQLIAKPGSAMTGTSRYNDSLAQALAQAGFEAPLTYPAPAPIPGPVQRGLKRVGLDTEAFFANYPMRAHANGADIHHLTSQTMATMLLAQRFPGPVIVTVLDIIPYLLRHDPDLKPFRHRVEYLFDRLAMIGLRRADILIAISEYTKRTLVEELGLPAERIYVTHLAVDHDRFRPLAVPGPFRAKYGLDEQHTYLLYVGSEDPRKNLTSLVEGFAQVRRRTENVKLLKVGAAHFLDERERLRALVDELGLTHEVLFFDDVPDADLPLFYNVADIFVLPSLYEGFGLPVLEAMACGTPVICTNATSLPELVGEAALLTLGDSRSFAQAIQALLDAPERRLAQREQGLRQVARFRWQATASKTIDVYRVALERYASEGNGRSPSK